MNSAWIAGSSPTNDATDHRVLAARFAPEFCTSLRAVAKQSSVARRTRYRLGHYTAELDGFVSLAMTKKGKRNADKRVFRPSASSQTSYALGATRLPCGAHPAGCARLSAFHRGSRQGAFAPFAQLQARLPGTRSQDALAGRALPVPTCPSPENAPPAPAVVPASMMPEAARVRGANPPAGTALAPPSRIASRTRPT